MLLKTSIITLDELYINFGNSFLNTCFEYSFAETIGYSIYHPEFDITIENIDKFKNSNTPQGYYLQD